MNTSIWKFDLLGPDTVDLNHALHGVPMPQDAKILCVHEQGNRPMLWAAVDPEAKKILRKILIQGTGDGSIEKIAEKYIGSVFLDKGAFVFHFFDYGEQE